MVRIKPTRGEEQVVDRVCNVDRGLVLCPTIDLVCAKVLAYSAPGLTDKIEDLADRCLVAAVCAAEVELDGFGRRNGGGGSRPRTGQQVLNPPDSLTCGAPLPERLIGPVPQIALDARLASTPAKIRAALAAFSRGLFRDTFITK